MAFDDFGADGMPDLNLMGIDGEFSLKHLVLENNSS